MGLLAVGGVVDRIAGVGQGLLQLTRQIGVVFDQENAHSKGSFFSRAS